MALSVLIQPWVMTMVILFVSNMLPFGKRRTVPVILGGAITPEDIGWAIGTIVGGAGLDCKGKLILRLSPKDNGTVMICVRNPDLETRIWEAPSGAVIRYLPWLSETVSFKSSRFR